MSIFGSEEVEKLQSDIKRLRQVVSDVVKALDNGGFCSTNATIEFMEGVPKEVGLVVARLKKEQDGWKQSFNRASGELNDARSEVARLRNAHDKFTEDVRIFAHGPDWGFGRTWDQLIADAHRKLYNETNAREAAWKQTARAFLGDFALTHTPEECEAEVINRASVDAVRHFAEKSALEGRGV